MKAAKKKVEEEWKAKVLVENPYIKTTLCMNKNSQLDKIKVRKITREYFNNIFRVSGTEKLRRKD